VRCHLDSGSRQFPGATVQDGLVDVAERDDARPGDRPQHLEVVIPFAAHADHPDPDRIVRAQGSGRRRPRQRA
jgi:hypothetical protein